MLLAHHTASPSHLLDHNKPKEPTPRSKHNLWRDFFFLLYCEIVQTILFLFEKFLDGWPCYHVQESTAGCFFTIDVTDPTSHKSVYESQCCSKFQIIKINSFYVDLKICTLAKVTQNFIFFVQSILQQLIIYYLHQTFLTFFQA